MFWKKFRLVWRPWSCASAARTSSWRVLSTGTTLPSSYVIYFADRRFCRYAGTFVQISLATAHYNYGRLSGHRHSPSKYRASSVATPYEAVADATTNFDFDGVQYPLHPLYPPFFPYWQYWTHESCWIRKGGKNMTIEVWYCLLANNFLFSTYFPPIYVENCRTILYFQSYVA